MTIERHVFETREDWLAARRKDVTASDIACLFGCHPYRTALQLYVEKNGIEFESADNGVLRRGRILEDAVARAVQEDKPGWTIEKAVDYLRDPAARIGCTRDYLIRDGDRLGVMQTKTVERRTFAKQWGETPPMWVVLQNATELMLSEIEWGVIAALIVDPYKLDLHLYELKRDEGVETKLRERVAEFWLNTDQGVMPPVDFDNDATALSLLYPTETDKALDLSGDNLLPELLEERELLGDTIREATARKVAIDNEIKAQMGDAAVGTLSGWRITWKTRAAYTANVKASRVLKCLKLASKGEKE